MMNVKLFRVKQP